jgi:hypothetical protein
VVQKKKSEKATVIHHEKKHWSSLSKKETTFKHCHCQTKHYDVFGSVSIRQMFMGS